MKKAVKVEEVEGEGLLALLDERVTLMCMNYIYTGLLAGVNDSCVLLEDASLVYDTGSWGSSYSDAQKLPSDIYVQTSAIEAFGVLDSDK